MRDRPRWLREQRRKVKVVRTTVGRERRLERAREDAIAQANQDYLRGKYR